MIKAVIFDIDNTLYSYDENHIYGMEALAVYCRDSFGITTDEMQACYRKAGRIMTDRIGTDTAAIHSRMLRMQCMLELLEQPLFPHARNMYHAYWDTFIQHIQSNPGILEFMKELKKRKIRIGIGTDMTAYVQYRKLEAHYHFFDICVEKAGVRPEECAFIGDNVRKDIEGAWESGMKGIWYTQEKEPSEHRYFPTIRSFRGIDVDEFLK